MPKVAARASLKVGIKGDWGLACATLNTTVANTREVVWGHFGESWWGVGYSHPRRVERSSSPQADEGLVQKHPLFWKSLREWGAWGDLGEHGGTKRLVFTADATMEPTEEPPCRGTVAIERVCEAGDSPKQET
jgi:hypothetical protein